MYLDKFFSYIEFEKRFSKHTIEAYRSDLLQFADFLSAEYKIQNDDSLLAVNHRQIRAWIIRMMEEKMSPKSVNRKISSLKTYYKFLIRNGVIQKNPLLKVVTPKTSKPLPVFVEKKGMDKVFDILRNYPDANDCERYTGLRDLLIVELLYGTGMRRSELLSLREDSFDLSRNLIKVKGKGNKERLIPFGKNLADLYPLYLNAKKAQFGENEFFLLSDNGRPAYPDLIYKIVKRLLSQTTSLERKSPHVLRHTFATLLSNNGAELNAVKELLGHASLASTQVYTHNKIEKLKEIHHLAHPKA